MSRIKLLTARAGLVSLLLLTAVSAARAQVFVPAQGRVENASHAREGTTITVTYDLVSSDPKATFKVALVVSIAGMEFKAQTVTGDTGDKVTPGTRKKIVWQSAADIENQEYEKFEFKVTATSSVLTEVKGDPTGSAKPITSPDLRGMWRGTYAGSETAELSIDRQDGASFSGTLRVAMKKGDDPTELNVDGSATMQLVVIREVSVLKPGKLRTWNLGSGSGTLQLEGQQMVGTGTDSRTIYQWSFTRLGAGDNSPPPRAPTPTPRPATPPPGTSPPPSESPLSSNLSGSWAGTYSGFPAELTLTMTGGTAYSGTLLVTTSKGKEPTELGVEVLLNGESTSLRETRVVSKGAASSWNLGTATGILRPDNRLMSGSGRDSRGSYKWSFTRQAVAGNSPPPGAPAQIPASSDLSGSWEGTYSGFPAELTLVASGTAAFSGTLLVTTSNGKAPTELSVEVLLKGEAVSLRETKLVSKGAASSWNLGTATGILQPDNRLMSGSGKDSRGSYKWSLMKK